MEFINGKAKEKFCKNFFNNLIDTIVDYSNVKIFGTIATYTAISLLDFNKETQLAQYIMMKNKTENKT